jgi:hypothetical protein
VIGTAMRAEETGRHKDKMMKADKVRPCAGVRSATLSWRRPTRRAVKGLSLDFALRPLP